MALLVVVVPCGVQWGYLLFYCPPVLLSSSPGQRANQSLSLHEPMITYTPLFLWISQFHGKRPKQLRDGLVDLYQRDVLSETCPTPCAKAQRQQAFHLAELAFRRVQPSFRLECLGIWEHIFVACCGLRVDADIGATRNVLSTDGGPLRRSVSLHQEAYRGVRLHSFSDDRAEVRQGGFCFLVANRLAQNTLPVDLINLVD